jgi:cytochrome P450
VSQEELRRLPPTLTGADPPVHTAQRRMIITEFTIKRVRTMRPRIQQIVDGCVDAMLDGPRPVDLVQALSLPVPSLVTCELLGVPYTDQDFFQEITGVLLRQTTGEEDRKRAVVELMTYLDKLVSTKESDPGDDLFGRLVIKNREAGVYDHQQLVGLARLLLFAGHETTANMISMGTTVLLQNPDRLAEIKADPLLLPKAVDELLRYCSIVDMATSRVATADIELGGVLIRAGDGVLPITSGANWDESVFDEPERFDPHRGALHHIAFGYGAHQCLGQHLARLELEVVLGTLFDRIPDLRLAVPVEDLRYKHDASVYGLYEAPVTW